MKVILKEKIGRFGKLGDIVDVKNGFALNFLLPQKKALIATPKNIEYFSTIRAQIEEKIRAETTEIAELCKLVQETKIILRRKTTDEGHLFASISDKDVQEAFAAKNIHIHKEHVQLKKGKIREVGEYEIQFNFGHDFFAKTQLSVVSL